MTTFMKLIENWPRIIVLYPSYLKLSSILESAYPLVKKVRENPHEYYADYISERGSIGVKNEMYQVIELATNINGKHVEIMAVLFRKENILGYHLLNREFIGHTLVELPDSPMPKCNIKMEKLSENFY